jgi:acetolactate synthase-1/2/3 large subunit
MSQAVRNGADVILEMLKNHGTDCIFASPIAAMAPLWEALAVRRERGEQEVPRYFQCRHEMLAVALASGYYKATGRAQTVFLPTGLGVLHGAMALRSAHQERTPMTVLSPDAMTFGEVPELDAGLEWPAVLVDLGGPARDAEQCVKWAKDAKTAGDLVNDLQRALYFADAIPRGPTLLGVPFELMMSPAAYEPRPKLVPQPVMAPASQLDELAGILARAEEPIILTEYGGRTESESAALLGLAEALSAPIIEFLFPAYHNAPRSHPLVIPGPAEPVLGRADVIVVVGQNSPWHPPKIPLRPGAVVIQIEEDPLRPRCTYFGYHTTHAVAGERELNVRGLVERVRQQVKTPPVDRARRWKEHKDAVLAQGRQMAEGMAAQMPGAVPAHELFGVLHHMLPETTSIVDEVVAEALVMPQVLFQSKPFRQYRGWVGALGTGLGTALGVKLARPSDTVACIIGDGAFHYNPAPAALGFSQQYRAPLLIVVCNNAGYQSQRWNVFKYFGTGAAVRTGQFFGSDLDPMPDYARVAEAYGATGERVVKTADLEPAIERALATVASGRTALLDVLVAP